MENDDGPLRNHKIYRLIYDEVNNHPHKKSLCALHGTVIIRGGSVLSWGLNDPARCGFSEAYKSHPGWTQHSELNAIKRVRRKIDLTGATCFNLRIDKCGNVRNSKPCASCEKLLINYGIKKCFYTTNEGSIEYMRLKVNQVRHAALAV